MCAAARIPVSVLLPFRLAEAHLERAVDSVMPQLGPGELIIVKNQTEPSPAAARLQKRYSEAALHLIEVAEPGIVPALNTGLKRCQYRFVARMDADDWMPPNRLRLQSEALQQHDWKLVSGTVHFAGNAQSQAGYAAYVDQINRLMSSDEIADFRFVESPFAHPSVMFKYDPSEGELYRQGAFPEDYELWLRWLSQGHRMGKIPETVLHWSDPPERLSRNHAAYTSEAFDAVRLHYLALYLKTTVHKPLLLVGVGKKARRKAEQLAAWGLQFGAISDLIPRQWKGLPFYRFDALPSRDEYHLLSLVSNRGSAFEIDRALQNQGFRRGTDFTLAG